MKNLKKKMNLITTTPTIGEKWMQFGKALANFDKLIRDKTRTDNAKGKPGKLSYINYWNRRFKDGNRKFLYRLFEKKPFDNAAGFIKGLEKRGFEVLGTGAFSTVLAKPGQKRVVKVIRRPDGWINYIHWAAQIGEAGHFAPRVYSYKKIKGRKSEFAVAIMERLSYTLDATPEDHAMKIVPALLWRADKNEMARKFAETLAPGLVSFLEKMSEQWKIPMQNFDLHPGNMMVRTDGSFVVVDPVSKGEEGYVRLKEGDFALPKSFSLLRILIESLYRHRGECFNKPHTHMGGGSERY